MQGEFIRLDRVIENLRSGNNFCFSVTKKVYLVSNIIFGITITFGDWAKTCTLVVSKTKISISGLRKNQTVRKIMPNNKNPSWVLTSIALSLHWEFSMSKLKLNLKRAPEMSLFIEELSLFGSFTLDKVIRVNKLF